MRLLLSKRIILYSIILLLILGVITVIFTPDIYLFKRGSHFAVHIMLIYLAMGLFFFIVNSRMLMYASMLCCLSLAIHLQNSTGDSMKYAQTKHGQNIIIAHLNVSELSFSYDNYINMLFDLEADVLSFHEVTPDWGPLLSQALSSHYTYSQSIVRIDPYGQAIYSKHPIDRVDTIMHKGKPSLKLKLTLKESSKPFYLVSSYSLPSLDRYSYLNLKDQLFDLAEDVQNSMIPAIIVGDFNIELWSNEIQDFKYNANMQDSRRALVSANFNGFIPNFNVSEGNIFYTNEIECTKFDPILDRNNEQVGVIGIYQFKTPQINLPRNYSR